MRRNHPPRIERRLFARPTDEKIVEDLKYRGKITHEQYYAWRWATVKDPPETGSVLRYREIAHRLRTAEREVTTRTIYNWVNAVWLLVAEAKQARFPQDRRREIPQEFHVHKHSGATVIEGIDSTAYRANEGFPPENDDEGDRAA